VVERIEIPVTLRPSKARTALLFLVSLLFVWGGILMIRDDLLAGYFVSGLFSLGLLVAVIQCIPNSAYLRLTNEGFTFCVLFRAHSVKWSEVEWFAVTRVGRRKMVGWNPTLGARQPSPLRDWNFNKFGVEEGLPDTYGLGAQALADVLNTLKEEHGERTKRVPTA
jgi:hypothetical protein